MKKVEAARDGKHRAGAPPHDCRGKGRAAGGIPSRTISEERLCASCKVGPNKGEKVPIELAALLEGQQPRARAERSIWTSPITTWTCWSSAAAARALRRPSRRTTRGAKVMIVTKLRIGDANTMMAEGGIQAADKPNDSPAHALSGRDGRRPLRQHSRSCSTSWLPTARTRSSG